MNSRFYEISFSFIRDLKWPLPSALVFQRAAPISVFFTRHSDMRTEVTISGGRSEECAASERTGYGRWRVCDCKSDFFIGSGFPLSLSCAPEEGPESLIPALVWLWGMSCRPYCPLCSVGSPE